MKKIFTLLVLTLSIAACTTKFNKGDVCHIEGGERNQHEVCVKK
jgi:hypothetical protein